VVEASIGVPAVLYNDWPDPYIGTQEDDITRADPTQMRRAVMTVAATAYYLASVPPERVPTLAAVMTGYAGARLATEGRRALTMLEGANPPDLAARLREALNVLGQAQHRELRAIRSLDRLGDGPSARAGVARAVRQIEGIHAASLAALRDRAAELAGAAGVKLTEPAPSPAEAALRRLVPVRADSLRGPVHFFRPEYGGAWLRRRTGDDDFRSNVRLARRGHYVLFEALSFADGKRSVLEIRDAVSAEYGPVPVEEVEEYFRFLERVGVVSLRQVATERSPSPT
jgi:hypothetical protein